MSAGIRCRRLGATAVASFLLFFAILAISGSADAASGRVALLQSPSASAGVRRCLTLIRDELMAGGFVVTRVDPGPATDPVSLAEVMQRQSGAVATIGLLGDPEVGPAELWILDNIGGKAEVRRIPAPKDDPERVAEVLAIRTIEVLRASALKLLIESSRPAPRSAALAAPQIVASPPAAALRAKDRFVAIETGLSLLVSPGGLDPAALPLARLRVAVAGPLVARLTLAGFGTRPRLETPRGTANIAQDLGLFEVGFVFRRDRRLQPAITLGGGVLHVGSQAQGSFPYLGQQDGRWAALFDAGAGLVAPIGGQLAIALEAHVLLASPHPVIRFLELEAATVARPAFWTTLTLVAWL
jgi:hypothetical protein